MFGTWMEVSNPSRERGVRRERLADVHAGGVDLVVEGEALGQGHGALLDATDAKHESALHLAVRERHLDATRALVAAGVSSNVASAVLVKSISIVHHGFGIIINTLS